MENCIFCGNPTSFKYEGEGEHANEFVCPKCQSEHFDTDFNTGCSDKDDCTIKLNRNP